MKIGLVIKQLREKNNISQEEMAKKLNLNQSQLCKIEKGQRTLKAEELIEISKIFRMSVEEFSKYEKEGDK